MSKFCPDRFVIFVLVWHHLTFILRAFHLWCTLMISHPSRLFWKTTFRSLRVLPLQIFTTPKLYFQLDFWRRAASGWALPHISRTVAKETISRDKHIFYDSTVQCAMPYI